MAKRMGGDRFRVDISPGPGLEQAPLDRADGATLAPESEPITLLHVGFPKTATTALQEHVFAGLPGICNLGKPNVPRSVSDSLRHIASDDPGHFDRAHVKSLRQAVREAKRDARAIVISHEGMTGSRRPVGRPTRAMREKAFHALRRATAERLYESFHEDSVRILFTIREQRSWLLSNFADLVLREGLSMDFGDWIRRGLDSPDDFYADPDYDRKIALYESLWGSDRVHVLVYEEMVADPDRFARSLADLGGLPRVEVEQRVRALPRTKTREQLSDPNNPYIVATRGNPERRQGASGVSVPTMLDAASEQAVLSRCAAGNSAISKRLGISLEKWGYEVDSAS